MDKELEKRAMLKALMEILLKSAKEGQFFKKATREQVQSPLLQANGSRGVSGELYNMHFKIKGIEKIKSMEIEVGVLVEENPELIVK